MYEKSFKSVNEQEEYHIKRWLKKNVGVEQIDWKIDIDDQWWIELGHGNVGVNTDITVNIYNPSGAFLFEIFQIGE